MSTHNQLHKVKKAIANIKQQRSPTLTRLTQQTHPVSIIQRAQAAPESLSAADVLQLQRTIGNQAVGQLMSEIGRLPPTNQQAPVQLQAPEEEEELMQGKFEAIQRQEPEEEEELLQGKFTSDYIQCQIPEEEELMQGKFASGLTDTLQAKEEAPPNKTGMPDHLKSGIETLSGIDLSGVRVHYNSPKPKQINALAYTQGQEIHVGSGQEKHLPHEGWHVVQQMQGRVKPTGEVGGMWLNDSRELESEADSMGAKATQMKAANRRKDGSNQWFGFVDNGVDAKVQRKTVGPLEDYIGQYVDAGDGLYVAPNPTDLDEVQELVKVIRAKMHADKKYQKIVILSGCHGDDEGNLYKESKFYTEDLLNEGLGPMKIYAKDVRLKSKRMLTKEITNKNIVRILGWCYSQASNANWDRVTADWAGF